jgi:hypothetical protein
MSYKQLWAELYRRFDPEEPVPADRPQWRAERTYSPVENILKRLSQDLAPPRFLLTGTIGSGKTTELRRITAERAPHDFVVFLDLVEHFHKVLGNPAALQKIESWEVSFLAGLAIYRAATELLDLRWDPDVLASLMEAWRAMAGATQTPEPAQLDAARLASSMVVLAASMVPGGDTIVKVLQSVTDTVKWNIPLGQSQKKLPDDDEQVRTMRDCVNRIIGEVQRQHRRVLLIIDGLDRLQDQQQGLKRAQALFIDSDMLARFSCALIVCGPFALRHHNDLSNIRGFDKFPILLNEPVLDQRDPANPETKGNGVAFFWDLFRQRVADLPGGEHIVPHELLLDLAYYSGGRARDFVRMIRILAERAHAVDAPQATGELIHEVKEEVRELLEVGITTEHVKLLRSIMDDPEHGLPGHERIWDLLNWSKLLPYPNRSEWFYPHPLLTISKVRPPRPKS